MQQVGVEVVERPRAEVRQRASSTRPAIAAAAEEATAKEIEGMGATRRWVSEDPEDPFVVLADPEGNEFCIVRAD